MGLQFYQFYGGQPSTGIVPLFALFSDMGMPPKQARDMLYGQLVQKNGLGVPRPSYYSVQDLHELPADEGEDDAQKPTLILAGRENGAQHG